MTETELAEISTTLKQILKWTRFAGMQQLKGIMLNTLKTDTEKLVYEFSTGEASTREIAKKVGLGSKSTVEKYWEKWAKVGIVDGTRVSTLSHSRQGA